MCDKASLRQPPKPKPGIKIEHAGIRKKDNWLIRRVELGQEALHQSPRESTVAVLAMGCYGSDLVAVVCLPIDHVPHGLAAHCADYAVVDDNRKDLVSSDPAPALTPIEK